MSIQKEAGAIIDPQTYSTPDRVNELLAKLRKEAPVCLAELEGYRPAWLITKHKDIEFVEGNPDSFIAGHRSVIFPREVEDQIAEQDVDKGLVGLDGDEHRKYRRLAQAWFMPRNLKTLESVVQDAAKRYVDLLETKAPECDFATDVAFWYPLRVVLGLAGLPEEADQAIVVLTQQIFGHQDDDLMADEQLSMLEVVDKFKEMFVPIVADRRANPGDDLISALVNAEVDGELIGIEEVMSYLIIVVTAGHDTTSASLAGGLLELMKDQEQLQRLKDNPDLIPLAVDEIIRWVSPVKHFGRTAVEDVEVGGQKIAKGEDLMLLFASAARDEEYLQDADKFIIDRPKSKHMAFGYGPHMCMGRYLANMELEAFLTELLPRIDTVELNGQPKYLASNFVSGLKSLPIKFSFK